MNEHLFRLSYINSEEISFVTGVSNLRNSVTQEKKNLVIYVSLGSNI